MGGRIGYEEEIKADSLDSKRLYHQDQAIKQTPANIPAPSIPSNTPPLVKKDIESSRKDQAIKLTGFAAQGNFQSFSILLVQIVPNIKQEAIRQKYTELHERYQDELARIHGVEGAKAANEGKTGERDYWFNLSRTAITQGVEVGEKDLSKIHKKIEVKQQKWLENVVSQINDPTQKQDALRAAANLGFSIIAVSSIAIKLLGSNNPVTRELAKSFLENARTQLQNLIDNLKKEKEEKKEKPPEKEKRLAELAKSIEKYEKQLENFEKTVEGGKITDEFIRTNVALGDKLATKARLTDGDLSARVYKS